MKRLAHMIGISLLAAICAGQIPAQTTAGTSPATASSSAPAPANPWDFNLSVTGYIVPRGQSYVSPTFTGDHDTLHVDARYNYEAQRTAALWACCDLSVGKKML